MNNPLLKDFETPFGSAPFSSINNHHFLPAFEIAIKEAKKEIDQIVANPAAADFENTLVALEFSGNRLNRISSVFFNLNAAETMKKFKKLPRKYLPC